jgi:glutamate-ammonia-ligase adenylyltransferase
MRRRERVQVVTDVVAMRKRMRVELDRSESAHFDLKQGEGGLVDLEFLLQAGVLILAAEAPELVEATRTPELIAQGRAAGWLRPEESESLRDAHAELVSRALSCTLDARPRLTARDTAIETARSAIQRAWARLLVA